ncbi:MAG: helix-turn-helix transcriptional regulator [Muribaculaceae bacterium]|nr:helix-turn-helix transcriptional regulator [Muribaculaceae bacterium]
MDILRKELNSIYEAQRLHEEQLPSETLGLMKEWAQTVVRVNHACAVLTDASDDRSFIYAGPFGMLLGISDSHDLNKRVDSSDEDEIYNRIHPEDLVEKRLLEYEFFKLADRLPENMKTALKATCRLRMKDLNGQYRIIDNSTQILHLSPKGNLWLILCCYDLAPDQSPSMGIGAHIVDNSSGEVRAVSFSEQRNHILSEREKEILRLIQKGKPSKQIADLLNISIHTVNRHRQNIIEKLSVGNCVEAIHAATAMNLL